MRADSSTPSPSDSALSDLERTVTFAEREELPLLLGRLEVLRATLTLRLFSSGRSAGSPTGQDRLLDVKESGRSIAAGRPARKTDP